MENDIVMIALELDRATHAKLVAWAKREKRSMQRQAEVVLTALVQQHDEEHKARGRRRDPVPA